MYSIKLPGGNEKKVCKGVQKRVVAEEISHLDYFNTLKNRVKTFATFSQFQSRAHTNYVF